ncbi:hypothetical protein LCGC14_2806720 [marine sediment metagenome]|uniref:Uncharacterized protein n=1 Tax=marine sediment metagenome TaxID=412755 RepID=A0A0F8Z7W4_9ZZZZ
MRKQLVYARRLLGDIGPLNTDPVRGLPGRIIAPAVSSTGTYQDYDEASATQNYTIGSRMVVDERVFHYAKAGNTLAGGLGAFNALTQHVSFALVAIAASGATSIVVTVGAGDGVAADGVIAADELVGGYVVIWPADMGDTMNRRVVGNIAATSGSSMTVDLDRPLSAALVGTDHAEIMASPYLNVQKATPAFGFHSVAGMPPIAATVDQYLWLQTWGPVWITPGGLGQASVGFLNRRVYFREDGSIDENPVGGIYADSQLAGYVLANAPGEGQGAPFIQLMLAP